MSHNKSVSSEDTDLCVPQTHHCARIAKLPSNNLTTFDCLLKYWKDTHTNTHPQRNRHTNTLMHIKEEHPKVSVYCLPRPLCSLTLFSVHGKLSHAYPYVLVLFAPVSVTVGQNIRSCHQHCPLTLHARAAHVDNPTSPLSFL